MSSRLSPTLTALIVTLVVIWAAYVTVERLRTFVDAHLALEPAKVAAGEFWQLVTALFIHADEHNIAPINLGFVILGLWFVGAAVEHDYGRRRFVLYSLVPGVVGNAVTTAVALAMRVKDLHVWGAGTAVMALFVVFGRRYDRTPMRVFGALALQARTLVLLLLGLSVFQLVAQGLWPQLCGELAAVGLAYAMAGGRGAGLRAWLRGLFGRMRGKRRRFQVVEGGRKEDRRSRYLN